ncbi:hypothetical protein JCM8208_006208 [Rhodotorula glutinis]
MATFNDLPVELVRHIWSFLKHDPAGKRHLFAALVPVVRRHLFETTCIQSRKRLQQFSALVERRGPFLSWPVGIHSVGTCVRRLTLPRVDVFKGCDQDATKKALVSVRRILQYCGEVEQLTCGNLGPMRVLLSLQAAPFLHLPKLKELFLISVEAERGTPLSQGHFVRLRRFPALRHLTIDFEWDGEGSEAFGALDTSRPRATGLSPVTKLSLYAGECLATPSAALFVADFAQLTHLELNIRDHVDLGPLLQACPITITALTIHLAEELEGEEIGALHVEADLARFVRLEELTLGAQMYSPTCELFPILSSHLPRLRVLTLELGTHLVADKLLKYVRARGGPSRRLEKVVLDSVEADFDPLPSLHPDRPDVVSGTFRFSRNWTLPEWTASFGLADAHELIAAAAKVGVELEGETVRAAEYDAVRAREEAYLQTRRDDILYSLRGLFEELEV